MALATTPQVLAAFGLRYGRVALAIALAAQTLQAPLQRLQSLAALSPAASFGLLTTMVHEARGS
jgi:hypothetical protein